MDIETLYRSLAPRLTNYLVANGTQYCVAAEIAHQMNVSESLVKVRIFRAKEKLKELLDDLKYW